jgi:hypothetical protein
MALQNIQQNGCQTGYKLKQKLREKILNNNMRQVLPVVPHLYPRDD